MDIKRLGFDKRFDALVSERDKRMELWREISEYVAPNMGMFTQEEPNSPVRRGQEILDSSVRRALQTLQAGMQGGLTSPSKAWLQLTVNDPELAVMPSVMAWVGDVRDILLNIFAQSNIYNRLHGAYGEIGAFGTAAIYLMEDENSVINARLLTAGEYAVSFDFAGLPNAFCRDLWMTAYDMVQAFGFDRLSQTAQGALRNNNSNQWFRIQHYIAEDSNILPDSKKLTRFPYFDVYWEHGQTNALYLGGHEEFPIMVPRWDSVGSDYYGYGPGEMALPESKTLQVMRAHFLKADELSIDPPVIWPQGLLAERANIRPGGVYHTSDPNNVARPLYQVQPNFEGHMQAMADSRRLIEQTFFADLFLMIANLDLQGASRDMTATEIQVRQQEKMQMLGPVVERLEYELLNPLVGRTYMIALRKGLIPEPPPELSDIDVKIEYISTLALAQKASSMENVNALVALTASLVGIEEHVVDKINADEIIDQFVKLSAIPASIVRANEEVEMIRYQRQQMMQQQQEMEQMAQMAQAGQAGGAGIRDIAQAAEMAGGLGGMMGGQEAAMQGHGRL